jgi:RimJ/RimL family protein N-acetyltransferase
VLRGAKVGLRARQESDVLILQSALHDDVETWARSDGRPWRPISPVVSASPYRVREEPLDSAEPFSVVVLAEDDRLAGEAVLWGIDLHNRIAHLGISLLPEMRGLGLGVDVVRVLCHYGFAVRGMHRLQIETLADNEAMLRAATRAGFTREGVLRRAAWVDGAFLDEVILGQLADEWSRNGQESAGA